MTPTVYFLRLSGMGPGPIKIGCTRSLPSRVTALAAQSPFELEVLATFAGSFGCERRLHKRFQHLRGRGEWFDWAPELQAVIDAINSGTFTDEPEAAPEKKAKENPNMTYADRIIDALGGTTVVANAIEAPTSTVHSWRKIGIPQSRLAHLKLIAEQKGVELPEAEAA